MERETGDLEAKLKECRRALEATHKELDKVVYHKEVAEWALVGIARSRVQIVEHLTGLSDVKAFDLSAAIGRRCAMELLHGFEGRVQCIRGTGRTEDVHQLLGESCAVEWIVVQTV